MRGRFPQEQPPWIRQVSCICRAHYFSWTVLVAFHLIGCFPTVRIWKTVNTLPSPFIARWHLWPKENTFHPSPYKMPRVLVTPRFSVTLLSIWVECTKTATNKVLRQYTKYHDGARWLITLPASPEDTGSVPSIHTWQRATMSNSRMRELGVLTLRCISTCHPQLTHIATNNLK